MTINDVQKAALILFAAREASGRSLAEMRAICSIMRNRVQRGWCEGNWMDLIETANEVAAHEPSQARINIQDRAFQMLARDIDQVFYGDDAPDELTDRAYGKNLEKRNPPLYWSFVDKPIRNWFETRIIRDPENHRNRGNIGLMMIFE